LVSVAITSNVHIFMFVSVSVALKFGYISFYCIKVWLYYLVLH
jgi:hypothetical protein